MDWSSPWPLWRSSCDWGQGRWGLWIYNDAPLRELATLQGVR